MGKILDFLSHEWVDEQLASRHGRARAASSRAKRDVQEVATKRLLRSLGDTAEEATWGCELREGMNRCELEYACDSPPTAIRQVCHELTERFRPMVQRVDFSEQQVNRILSHCQQDV